MSMKTHTCIICTLKANKNLDELCLYVILKEFKSKGNKLNLKTVQGEWLDIAKNNQVLII